MSGAKTLEVL